MNLPGMIGFAGASSIYFGASPDGSASPSSVSAMMTPWNPSIGTPIYNVGYSPMNTGATPAFSPTSDSGMSPAFSPQYSPQPGSPGSPGPSLSPRYSPLSPLSAVTSPSYSGYLSGGFSPTSPQRSPAYSLSPTRYKFIFIFDHFQLLLISIINLIFLIFCFHSPQYSPARYFIYMILYLFAKNN